MTSVLLNRAGTDIVDLSVTQTGSAETTVILKDALLAGDKDYRFAVTELTVPLQNIDMFGFLQICALQIRLNRHVRIFANFRPPDPFKPTFASLYLRACLNRPFRNTAFQSAKSSERSV